MTHLNDGYRASSIEVLEWCIGTYHPRIAIASSFSVEDTVVIDMATDVEPRIKVFYINTGFQFRETDEIKEGLKERYGLNLVEYYPSLSVEEQEREYAPQLCRRDPELCCKLRKIEPIKRALLDLDAWVTGLRREQSITRRGLKLVEREFTDSGRTIVKVNPIAHWTSDQVWDYINEEDLPYNPLYDEGYKSIGCDPCTRAVLEGEDERAGRWSDTDKLECGIHTFLKKGSSQAEEGAL